SAAPQTAQKLAEAAGDVPTGAGRPRVRQMLAEELRGAGMTFYDFDSATAANVIVTYNRFQLLSGHLTSTRTMAPKPGRVVVIDNASADDTTEVVESFRADIGTEIVYRRLETNTGGSGGFSEGMRTAYDLGAEWIWMMDDDVEVLPDGLTRMGRWSSRFKSIQGRRYDYDGSELYWQYRVADRMDSPIPFAPSKFDG